MPIAGARPCISTKYQGWMTGPLPPAPCPRPATALEHGRDSSARQSSGHASLHEHPYAGTQSVWNPHTAIRFP